MKIIDTLGDALSAEVGDDLVLLSSERSALYEIRDLWTEG